LIKEPNAQCVRPQCAEPGGRGDGSAGGAAPAAATPAAATPAAAASNTSAAAAPGRKRRAVALEDNAAGTMDVTQSFTTLDIEDGVCLCLCVFQFAHFCTFALNHTHTLYTLI
jgi:hypothetical protein